MKMSGYVERTAMFFKLIGVDGTYKNVLIICIYSYVHTFIYTCTHIHTQVHIRTQRGADKSLARPGRKQATATKILLLQATKKKKFRKLSFQPGLRGSNDLHVGRKMATFQLFFQSGRAKDLSAPL